MPFLNREYVEQHALVGRTIKSIEFLGAYDCVITFTDDFEFRIQAHAQTHTHQGDGYTWERIEAQIIINKI